MIDTVDLIKTLHLHHARFSSLLLLLKDEAETLTASTSLSYKSLVFKFEREGSVYIQVTYAFEEKASALTNFYSEDPKAGAFLAPYLESQILSSGQNSPVGYEPLSIDVNKSLTIAESIARQAHLCASGDDYSPGYFSKILVTSEGITLEQINHMNSRSLAHKQDYSLRNLEFFIPYNSQKPEKAGFDDEYIGAMRIHFSDRSSTNNRSCGNKIRQQIDAERAKSGS